MNNVFISYASPDKNVAADLCTKIKRLHHFHCELVEDRKQGDTTFTEKVITYFKICNIFIVIITDESLRNQFVNQEWGYARCLKEIGQIQLLLHITKLDYSGRRIESKGFISTNMDFIDLHYDKDGNPCSQRTITETVQLLKSKKSELIPIIPEKEQKLGRFVEELGRNILLVENIIAGREDFEGHLSIDPKQFQYDYALQLLQIGHLFPKSLYQKVENYIDLLKELFIQKEQVTMWAICRGQYHTGNTKNFFDLLAKDKEIFINLRSFVMIEL